MDFSKKTIFTEARSHKKFGGDNLSETDLRAIYELAKLAPTANNSCPLRVVFVNSAESMEQLARCALDFNQEKTRTAGSAAILAYDMDFHTHFATLAPHMKQPTVHSEWPIDRLERFALANANLQAGFMIAATRALGFDCGPMGGFDTAAVKSKFFGDTRWVFNCVVLLGHGDHSALRPRGPRLAFEDACRIT
ncbi:MAG: malonic semialdehyde reductase [Gammaproteobacteria bacterium]|nr:malonic semialdehyde reductase [Gammaproteobacteria bacterium]